MNLSHYLFASLILYKMHEMNNSYMTYLIAPQMNHCLSINYNTFDIIT